jgi:hypothetical protein
VFAALVLQVPDRPRKVEVPVDTTVVDSAPRLEDAFFLLLVVGLVVPAQLLGLALEGADDRAGVA